MNTQLLFRLHQRGSICASRAVRFWLLGAALLSNLEIHAQVSSTDLLPPKFIPTSPTLASFPRFDAQELVNLPTGAAQLSVPLADVSCGTLHLPVSLAYSYTGLQVYQPKDLVGLGWALQAGTSISLQVNGMLDTQAVGPYHYNPAAVLLPTQLFLKDVVENFADPAPDTYSFAVPGGPSGRFILQDTTVVMLPRQPLTIRLLRPQVGGGFQVTTEDGVRYQFQAVEQTRPGADFMPGNYDSAWHLTRIISTNNADTLRLVYTLKTSEPTPMRCAVTTGNYKTGMIENGDRVPSTNCGSPGQDYYFRNIWASTARLQVQYLTSITARGVQLLFKRDPNTQVVQAVQLVATGTGRHEIKTMTLFQSPFPGAIPTDRRVRLDSLQESANGLRLPATRFRYKSSANLPTRGSSAQDYWGYFNGAFSNGDGANQTAPALLADQMLGTRQANREPSFDFAVLGALEQVTYPTGGSTRWEYESGKVWYEPGEVPVVGRDSTEVDRPIAHYDPQGMNNRETRPGSRRYITPSDTVHFRMTQANSSMVVYLSRTPYTTDASHASNTSNLYKDFDIWQCLPTGDVLITTSSALGDYKSYDPYDGKHFTFQLQPGVYAIQVYCEATEDISSVRLRIPNQNLQLGQDLPGAGVRVRCTRTVAPGAPPLVRTYAYLMPDSLGGHGSGVTLAGGRGIRTEEYREAFAFGLLCGSMNTSSDNSRPGDEFKKYSFYYRRIIVRDSADHGATVSSYESLGYQFYDVVLVDQQVYRQHPQRPQQLQLAQRNRYGYFTDSIASFPILRARMTQRAYADIQNPRINEYAGEGFPLVVAFSVPFFTEQSRYDERGAVFVTSSYSTYAQQRLVRTATRTSTGWNIQRYKRLRDYSASPAVTALRVNAFNPVIETQTWHRPSTGTDSVLVSGSLTLFDPIWRSPAQAYRLRLAYPVLGLNQETRGSGGFLSWFSDTRYELMATARYAPSSGDLLEQRSTRGLPTSYVTGYTHTLVIASTQNAAYSQIAYTSFEPDATGRWRYDSTGTHRVTGGRTGRWAYRIDGTGRVGRTGLPAGDYELLFWAQGSVLPDIAVTQGSRTGPVQGVTTAPDDWHQYRARVHLTASGSIALEAPTSGGSVLIDEVRLHPVGAQMTSYTYDPLVGVTSQTDPSGRTVTYEYDGLSRLVRTRDEQGRVLSQQQYHYAGH